MSRGKRYYRNKQLDTACTVVQAYTIVQAVEKRWAKLVGEGDAASIFKKLKYIIIIRTRPRMQNFRELYRSGWTSGRHELVLPWIGLDWIGRDDCDPVFTACTVVKAVV